MRPRGLDLEALTKRLRMMRRLLDQLAKIAPSDPELLGAEFGEQLQVERILSALVDLAVAINTHVVVVRLGEAPHDMTVSFRQAALAGLIDDTLAAALAPSVGLRNILVHGYLDLDMTRMAAAVPPAMRRYAAYIEQTARWVQGQSEA